MEILQNLEDAVHELKLKYVGEPAAESLDEREKPKSAIQSDSELSEEELVEASPAHVAWSKGKVTPLKRLNANERYVYERLRNLKNGISHKMKQYRNADGGEVVLERKINTIFSSHSYLKERGKENTVFKGISVKKLKELEDIKSNL